MASAEPVQLSAPSRAASGGDALYRYDEATVEATRAGKPWMQDGKYFLRASISPTAAMKMLSHAQSGVDRGVAKSGKPIEIMGLLIGRPGTEAEGDSRRIVIVDAQPLPIEGMETRVVADDDDVINYMISVGEAVEMSRKERICGWYHSHPFDVGAHSNCFMSNTDVTTQLQWQRNEDRHGNPWLAIVVDPLRTIAKGSPEMKAFRVYPPEYSATEDQTPDGTIEKDNTRRMELWGGCWNRYYELELQYHASSLTSTMLSIARTNTVWMETLTADASRNDGEFLVFRVIHPHI
jgi:COP9 signalosome complex subunit 5